MAVTTKIKNWPELPYKGLSFYNPADAPLFAGRDNDVEEVATLLATGNTRILILHGRTGCGKSSFLRAGLIPYLENTDIGFQFLKDSKDGELKALFIRSSDKPLIELASRIYEFAKKDVVVKTPSGDFRALNLSEVVSTYSEAEFCERIGSNPEQLIDILKAIASKVTKTLVLIIDQGEEVVTLKPGVDGEKYRNDFFEFLSIFSKTDFDIKLLIALRTEFFGEFDSKMQKVDIEPYNIGRFFLEELNRIQLITAIERPTAQHNVKEYGVPYHHYRFSYEKELPEKIADDLIAKKLKGGVLPALQIVCDTLYQKTKPKENGNSTWCIKKRDYSALGSLEELMESYVNNVFIQLCKEHGISTDEEIKVETDKWKDVLATLAKTQVDGTITTEVLKAEDLEKNAKNERCRIPFGVTMDYLTKDTIRILRTENLVRLGTTDPIKCYSLGHDAIGLVLDHWKTTRKGKLEGAVERVAKEFQNAFRWIGSGLTLISLVVAVTDQVWWKSDVTTGALVFAAAAFFYFILSFLPERFLVQAMARYVESFKKYLTKG